MILLIDMIAWATALMWMDGMSESAESRLVLSFEIFFFFVKTCAQAFFCVGLSVTWNGSELC